MECLMCKGSLENKNTTFKVSYSNNVAKQLEKLVNEVRNSITEITVINYTEQVA